MVKRWVTFAFVGLGAAAGWGCSNKLETGYEPKRLNATAAERRGYYASPYTPESVAAQDKDKGQSPDYASRRPSAVGN